MKDIVITVNRKDYRASEIVRKLASARRTLERSTDPFFREMAEKEVADFAPALEKAGIPENATFEKLDLRPLWQQRRDAAKAARAKRNPNAPCPHCGTWCYGDCQG